VLSALQRGVFEPITLNPILDALRTLREGNQSRWGLLPRLLVAFVTLIFAMIMLLLLPFIAEAAAIFQVIQILHGMNIPLLLAIFGLALVNTAIVLIAWQGVTESLPETQAAIGAVVIPIIQDLEREQAKGNQESAGNSDHDDEDIPPLEKPA
jgi:hypothetical protein